MVASVWQLLFVLFIYMLGFSFLFLFFVLNVLGVLFLHISVAEGRGWISGNIWPPHSPFDSSFLGFTHLEGNGNGRIWTLLDFCLFFNRWGTGGGCWRASFFLGGEPCFAVGFCSSGCRDARGVVLETRQLPFLSLFLSLFFFFRSVPYFTRSRLVNVSFLSPPPSSAPGGFRVLVTLRSGFPCDSVFGCYRCLFSLFACALPLALTLCHISSAPKASLNCEKHLVFVTRKDAKRCRCSALCSQLFWTPSGSFLRHFLTWRFEHFKTSI